MYVVFVKYLLNFHLKKVSALHKQNGLFRDGRVHFLEAFKIVPITATLKQSVGLNQIFKIYWFLVMIDQKRIREIYIIKKLLSWYELGPIFLKNTKKISVLIVLGKKRIFLETYPLGDQQHGFHMLRQEKCSKFRHIRALFQHFGGEMFRAFGGEMDLLKLENWKKTSWRKESKL